MRLAFAFLCLTALASCDTAPPEYWGVEPTRVHVGKSTFDVRQRDDKAQAIRMNSEWAPRPEAVMPRALVAIEQASGCEVTRMDGDQVIIEARLDCGDGAQMSRTTLEYECEVRMLVKGVAELTCREAI